MIRTLKNMIAAGAVAFAATGCGSSGSSELGVETGSVTIAQGDVQTITRAMSAASLAFSDLKVRNPIVATLPGYAGPASGGGTPPGSGGGVVEPPPASRLTLAEFDQLEFDTRRQRGYTAGLVGLPAPTSGSATYNGDILIDFPEFQAIGQFGMRADFARSRLFGNASAFVVKGNDNIPADAIGIFDFDAPIVPTFTSGGSPSFLRAQGGTYSGSLSGKVNGRAFGATTSGSMTGVFTTVTPSVPYPPRFAGEINGFATGNGTASGPVTGFIAAD